MQGCSVSGWGVAAQAGISSAVIVFFLPVADHNAGLGQRPEAVDVGAFVASAAAEPFNVAVAAGSASVTNAEQTRSAAQSPGTRNWSVAAAQGGGVAAIDSDSLMSPSAVIDRSTSRPKHSRVCFIDDGDDLDRACVVAGIESEVHCPYTVGCLCLRGGGGFQAFRRRSGPRNPSSRQRRWIFL